MRLKTFSILIGTALASYSSVSVGENRSPRVSNGIFQIGGGQLSTAPTKIISARDQRIGISFNSNMKCGEFDPKISISNQLNGITEGFQNMMGNIITQATNAVASLPGLALQKASPELYDMLQQGVLQGKMDFEWAEVSCEDMQRVITGQDSFPFENFKLSAKYKDWSWGINNSNGDAVKAKQDAMAIPTGNQGVDWVCQQTRGGLNQDPIETIKDVAVVGYNILFDRTNSCDTGGISTALAEESSIAAYWRSPLDAANWMVSTIGDVRIRTCDGCEKMVGVPGKGLMYKHRENMLSIKEDLIDLVDGNTQLNWQNLQLVSAPPSVNVEAPLIHSIRKRDAYQRLALIDKISSEIAYVRMNEQAKLGTRLLMTGIKEPNAAMVEGAKLVVNQAIDDIQTELSQLAGELQVKNDVATGTIRRLMLLDEKRVLETQIPSQKSKSPYSKRGGME